MEIGTNILLITIVIMALIIAALGTAVIVLWRKLHRFLLGRGAETLGDSLDMIAQDVGDLKSSRKEIEEYLKTVEKRLRKSVQSVHTVRFNPWQGTGEGGAQSFATALMNENGDGVVISSLYARDHVSIFGKPIQGRSSEHELSDEERRAMDIAAAGLKN